jgi:acetyltransferase-like isoleucine patch superfamily enzyme
MEPYASLAPGVAAGGDCRIGQFAAVGIGASLAHGRTVGEHAVVGAGAVVMKDVPEREVWYGVPARFVRGREPGEAYL